MTVQLPNPDSLPSHSIVNDWDGFQSFLVSGVPTAPNLGHRPLDNLRKAIRQIGKRHFFSELLPQIIDTCKKTHNTLAQWLPIVGPTTTTHIVIFTQYQCLCILCNSFLCQWEQRSSSNCVCAENPSLPSINCDELFAGCAQPQVAKIRMLLEYFNRQFHRLQHGDSLSRTITFTRLAAPPPITPLSDSKQPMCAVKSKPLKSSIEEATDTLRVDFANSVIGGGVLAYGCVQEEILFACCPEAICTRLVFSELAENEAILLVGVEKFSKHKNYGVQLEYSASYIDTTEVVDNVLQSYVVCMDALDFRHQSSEFQYSVEGINRELVKAIAAFTEPHFGEAVTAHWIPRKVSTGNWGSGAFCGDPRLKSLLQWIACSYCGKDVLQYFPYDNKDLHKELPVLAQLLTTTCSDGYTPTVGEVVSLLMHSEALQQSKQEGKTVYQYVYEYFNNVISQKQQTGSRSSKHGDTYALPTSSATRSQGFPKKKLSHRPTPSSLSSRLCGGASKSSDSVSPRRTHQHTYQRGEAAYDSAPSTQQQQQYHNHTSTYQHTDATSQYTGGDSLRFAEDFGISSSEDEGRSDYQDQTTSYTTTTFAESDETGAHGQANSHEPNATYSPQQLHAFAHVAVPSSPTPLNEYSSYHLHGYSHAYNGMDGSPQEFAWGSPTHPHMASPAW